MGEHVNIQGPTVAHRSRSGPVFSHCAYLQLVLPAVHLPTPLAQTWLPVSTAMVVHTDSQSPRSCQGTYSWPQLLLPALLSTTTCDYNSPLPLYKHL